MKHAYTQMKKWHIALGILMAIPLMTLAITGSLIIHNRPLGLREVTVQADWFAGYQADKHNKDELKDVKAYLSLGNERAWAGTDYGLVEITPSGSRLVPEFEQTAIISLQSTGQGLLVCTQKGAWLQEKTGWRRIYKGECKQAGEMPDKTLTVLAEGKGILISTDRGIHWKPHHLLKLSLSSLPEHQKRKPLTATRLLLDIHTGHIFWGKEWKWLWVDFLAILGLSLSASGLWLWLRTRKPKKGVKH